MSPLGPFGVRWLSRWPRLRAFVRLVLGTDGACDDPCEHRSCWARCVHWPQ